MKESTYINHIKSKCIVHMAKVMLSVFVLFPEGAKFQ